MTVAVNSEGTICNNGSTIGHIQLNYDSDHQEVTIVEFEILPEHRNHGYATETLTHLIANLATTPVKTVKTTHMTSPKMRSALRSAGFDRTHTPSHESTTFEYHFT